MAKVPTGPQYMQAVSSGAVSYDTALSEVMPGSAPKGVSTDGLCAVTLGTIAGQIGAVAREAPQPRRRNRCHPPVPCAPTRTHGPMRPPDPPTQSPRPYLPRPIYPTSGERLVPCTPFQKAHPRASPAALSAACYVTSVIRLIATILSVAPHTPNPWGHVELVSKDVGIG